MKIRNDLIRIKIGNKKYDFNNLILDEYLKRFANAQLDKDKSDYIPYLRKIDVCLLKLDTPLEIQNNSEIHNQDFDISINDRADCKQTINEKEIIAQYSYSSKVLWDINAKKITSISNYYGKKITAIAFNGTSIPDTNYSVKFPVCAILDTSNYNIYIQENQDIAITRRDIITTDAEFYSNSKTLVPGPLHLAPCGGEQIIYQPNIYSDDGNAWQSFYNNAFGILHSVGLSSYKDYIDKEFIVGEDVEAEVSGTELTIKGIEEYLANNTPLFSNANIYPSSSLYPIKTNYKYIILKYKVYQIVNSGTYNNVTETVTDTEYYYYQSIPIDKFGKLNLKIKYERG